MFSRAASTSTILLALAIWAGFARAQSACPVACVECSPNYRCTTAPHDSLACAATHGYGPAVAVYDIPTGRLYAEGNSSPNGAGHGRSVTQDHYWLTGPATGVPVTIVARLRFRVLVCGRDALAGAHASLAAGSSRVDSPIYRPPLSEMGLPTCADVDSMLTLQFSTTPGELFQITCEVSAGGGIVSGGQCEASLSFASASPVLGTILSCNGYQQDEPTSPRRTFWGAVKAIWR